MRKKGDIGYRSIYKEKDRTRRYGLMGIFALALLSAALVAFGEEETLFRKDFGDNEHFTSDWSLYEQGTGSINSLNGCAFVNITDQSKAGEYSVGALQSNKMWKFAGLEIRLRCSDNVVKGGRTWGFRDSGTQFCVDSMLFACPSPESDDAGFCVRCGVGGTFVFREILTGVDLSEWHTYKILWEPNNGTFIIDDEVVASTDKVPKYSMVAHVAETNMANRGGKYASIDIPYNEHIEVDYVRIFGVPEPIILSILSLNIPVVFKKLGSA